MARYGLRVGIRDTDTGWKTIKGLASASSTRVEVGVFDDSPHTGSDLSVAEIAMVHEYGTASIPARSPLGSTFDRFRPSLEAIYAQGLARATTKRDLRAMMARLGQFLTDRVRAAITEGRLTPALAQSTITRKGHGIPLLDTGQLRDAVTWRIVMGPKR